MEIGAQTSEQTVMCFFFLPVMTAPDSEMKPSGGQLCPDQREGAMQHRAAVPP